MPTPESHLFESIAAASDLAGLPLLGFVGIAISFLCAMLVLLVKRPELFEAIPLAPLESHTNRR